jgi:hypothetical protein
MSRFKQSSLSDREIFLPPFANLWMTGKPKVIDLSVGLVLTNALILIGLATSPLVQNSGNYPEGCSGKGM